MKSLSPFASTRMELHTPLRRLGVLAYALFGAGLLLAACAGGPQPSTVPSGSTATDGSQSAAAYAQCMRSHGLPNFPDPNSQGQFLLRPANGVNPNSSQYQAAQQACQPLLPAGSPGQQPDNQAAALKFAKCMRSNGIPNFPDPQQGPGGGTLIGGAGIDPNSPAFQSALQACRSLLPSNGGAIGGG